MESFGVFIKSEREKRGIRLEEIASITKIHLHTLEMLEEGEWEKLPPEPFIRGFITAYGKYVGLDTRDLIQRYCDEVGEQESDQPENLTPPQDAPQNSRSPGQIIENSGPFPVKKILSGLGMVGVLGLLFTIVYLGKQAAENTRTEGTNQVTSVAPQDGSTVETDPGATLETATAESDAAETTAQTETETAMPKPSERATSTAKAEKTEKTEPEAKETSGYAHTLMVKSKEETWVKAVVDNRAPVESFLKEGESKTFQARQKIKVTLGNSSGAVVTHNGKEMPGKQFLGTIKTYQYPANATFPRDRNPSASSSSRRD